VKRWTTASALSAVSRQPLSMISACPRPGIFSISVTPWVLGVDLGLGQGFRLAAAAWNSGLPGVGTA
jgi:hypothetical protein